MDELQKQITELLEQYIILFNLICASNCTSCLRFKTDNLFSMALMLNHYTIININYSENNGFAIKIAGEKNDYVYMDNLNQCKKFINKYLTSIQTYLISKKN